MVLRCSYCPMFLDVATAYHSPRASCFWQRRCRLPDQSMRLARRNFDESGVLIFCFGKQARAANSLVYPLGELVSLFRLLAVQNHDPTVACLREELLSLRQMIETALEMCLDLGSPQIDRKRNATVAGRQALCRQKHHGLYTNCSKFSPTRLIGKYLREVDRKQCSSFTAILESRAKVTRH